MNTHPYRPRPQRADPALPAQVPQRRRVHRARPRRRGRRHRSPTLPVEGKPEEFVADLEALGPTFIKIGQALSTRPDMVPPAYLAALERMQDDVAPVDVRRRCARWSRTNSACASASLREFDETAARLPHRWRRCIARRCATAARSRSRCSARASREVIRADLDALASLAGKADRVTDLGRRVHFADWVHEFRKTLMAELDYRLRGREPRALRRTFRRLSGAVRARSRCGT